MKIKDKEIKNNLFLAPMAGYTNFAFREQCKKFGAGLTTTEMISAKGLIYDSEKTKLLLITSPLEEIKVIQLFGKEPEIISKAISSMELENFDIIDINMGCPATKIVKNGEGSFLMKDFSLAQEIVATAVRATKRPITVKMRLGYDEDVSIEFAKMLQKAGASAITVHGRLKTDGYSGTANYQAIAKVKKAVDIPVVANGDVKSKADYDNVLKITNADAIMIGRATIGNPFIFSEILGYSESFDAYKSIEEQFQQLLGVYDEHFVVTNMRKHLIQYLKLAAASVEFRQQILLEESAEKVLKKLKAFYYN